MPHRIVQSISPRDRDLVLALAMPTASSGDVEHGPASAPTLLMTRFAVLEGADAAGGRR
jgi:hypothetical protein